MKVSPDSLGTHGSHPGRPTQTIHVYPSKRLNSGVRRPLTGDRCRVRAVSPRGETGKVNNLLQDVLQNRLSPTLAGEFAG